MGVETRGGLWGIRPLPLPRGCLFSRADPQSPVLPHAVGTQERGTSDPGPLPACNPLPRGGERADWQVRVGQTKALPSPGPSQQVPVLPWLLDTASGDNNSSSRNHSLCLTSQVEGTEHGGVAQLVNPSPSVFTFLVSLPHPFLVTQFLSLGVRCGACAPLAAFTASQSRSLFPVYRRVRDGGLVPSFCFCSWSCLAPTLSAGSSLGIPERK